MLLFFPYRVNLNIPNTTYTMSKRVINVDKSPKSTDTPLQKRPIGREVGRGVQSRRLFADASLITMTPVVFISNTVPAIPRQ